MPFVFTSLAGEVAETTAGWMAGRLADAATDDATAHSAPPVVPPGMAGPPATGGGVLRLQPDQIDSAIAVFEAALDKLEKPVRRASDALKPGPTAADQVSQDASVVFGRAADPALAAWRGAVGEIRSVIDQLEAAKRAHLEADAAGQAQFSGQG